MPNNDDTTTPWVFLKLRLPRSLIDRLLDSTTGEDVNIPDALTLAAFVVRELETLQCVDHLPPDECPPRYIPQSLVPFIAGLKSLPPETEVVTDSGYPAGWTYSRREGKVYIHKS